MSSSNGNNVPPDVLSGDYMIYAVVSDFGTADQSEEWVSYSMGENTIAYEPEAVEANLHEYDLTQQYPRHGTLTVEGTFASMADNQHWQTLGLTNDSGGWTDGRAVADVEAFRVHIFDTVPTPDAEPQSSYEFTTAKIHVGEITHSVGDPGEEPFVMMVNGGWSPTASAPPSGTNGGGGGG